eukprot:scaffold51615_cov33-Attheya_sp.AAC.1
MRNRNKTGAIASPCLTPTVYGIDLGDALLTLRLTLAPSYSLCITFTSWGGTPYLCSILYSRVWFAVSNDLTRSTKRPHVGRLWFLLSWIIVRIAYSPSWHPLPGWDPN